MNEPMKEDYNEMRIALFKCRKFFSIAKHKHIEKKDYERAAKARQWERLCDDALKVKTYKNYYSIIVTDRGITSNLCSDNFMYRMGMMEMASTKISEDKTEMLEKCEHNLVYKKRI